MIITRTFRTKYWPKTRRIKVVELNDRHRDSVIYHLTLKEENNIETHERAVFWIFPSCIHHFLTIKSITNVNKREYEITMEYTT